MEEAKRERPDFGNSWFFWAARVAWRNEFTPFRVVRSCGCCTRGRVLNFIRARLKPTPEREDVLTDYMMEIFKLPGTTEVALGKLFNLLRARFGLDAEDRFASPEFTTPFSVLFGDDDWVKTASDMGASPVLIEKKRAQFE